MRVPGYELSLGPEVTPRPTATNETVASYFWRRDWQHDIDAAIASEDGWAVLVQYPNCDLHLFDVGHTWEATARGGTAWIVIARETRP